MWEVFEKLRLERGVSAYQVCKECGLQQSQISNWKAGRYSPKIDKLKRIADYFGVTLDYLMTGVQTDEQPLPYYLNDETKEIANAVYSSSDLRLLFDNSRKMKPEDLKVLIAMQEAILRKEKN